MSPGTGMYFISNGGGVDEAGGSSPLYFSSLENQKEAEVAPTDLRLFRRFGLFLSMFLLTHPLRGAFFVTKQPYTEILFIMCVLL